MRKTIVALILCLITACSWFSSKESTISQTAQSCAAADLGQPITVAGVTASLSMQVVQILAAGDADWETALEALAAKVGEDVLVCAVQVAEAIFRSPAPADAGVSGADAAPSVDGMFPGAHDRAAAYLSTHASK